MLLNNHGDRNSDHLKPPTTSTSTPDSQEEERDCPPDQIYQ